MSKIVSKHQSLTHYKWGNNCDGWILADEINLSVKQERMPAGSSEELHLHKKSQQFFFILKGTATFEIDNERLEVKEQEGITIKPGIAHRIMNYTAEDLEFILSTQPSAQQDRHLVTPDYAGK